MHNHPNCYVPTTDPHAQHRSCSGCGTSIKNHSNGLVFACQHFSCLECSKSSPPICPACKDPNILAVDLTDHPDGLKYLFESPMDMLKNAMEVFIFQSEHYRASMIRGWKLAGALKEEVAALQKEIEKKEHDAQRGEDQRTMTVGDLAADQGTTQSRVVRKLQNVFWKEIKSNPTTLAQNKVVVPAALDLQDGDDRPLSAISLASSSAAIAPAVGRPNGVQSHSNRPLSMAKNKTQTLRMAGTSKQRRRKRVQDDNVEVGKRQSLNLEAAAGKQSRDRSNSFASTTASESDSSLQLSQRPRTVSSPVPSRTMSRLSSGTVRTPNSAHTPMSALVAGNENRMRKSTGLLNNKIGIDGISRPTSSLLRQHSALPEHSHIRLRSPQLPYLGDGFGSRGGTSSRPTSGGVLLSSPSQFLNIKRPGRIEEGGGGHKPNALSQFVGGGVSISRPGSQMTRNKQPMVGIPLQVSTGQMEKPSYLSPLRSPTTPTAQAEHTVLGEGGGGLWQKTRGGIPRRPDIQYTLPPSQTQPTGIALRVPYSKP